MKYFLATIAISALLAAEAACPNQCSGHGRCGRNDKCACYQQEGKTWGFRYGYTGADCSLRTCPLGIAFDQIKTDRNKIVMDTGNSKMTVFADRDYVGEKIRQYTVRMVTTTTFQWKDQDDEFFTSPIAAPTAESEAFELEKGTPTGVRVYFDPTVSASDEWTFTAYNNNGDDWVRSDDNTVHQYVECSGRGTCDSTSGRCECFPGYSGEACQRTTCPNRCSGHGVCMELRRFVSDFASDSGVTVSYDQAYDARKEMGCLCDEGFRGPDCSQIECPSGPDPLDPLIPIGGKDCSGRGLCDYSTGLCQCFKGYFGERCETQTNFV